MIVKGIIKSIDYSGNTCTVRIPIFESAANENEVVVSAILSTLPGIYNGYKEEDVVFIAFENNDYDMPVVIGKLYLGVENEKNDPRGAIVCNNITATQPISIPISSQLTLDNDPQHSPIIGVDKGIDSYKSIADLAKNLQKQDEKIGSLSVKVIDDGENLGAEIQRLTKENILQTSKINQNAESITAEVSRASDAEGVLKSQIKQTADEINAEVSKKIDSSDETKEQRGLGWNLNTENWKINAKDTVTNENGETEVKNINIVTIDRNGMSIAGDLKLSGYPRNITVLYAQTGPNENYPKLYDFTEVKFPVPFPVVGEDKDKTWYYGKYIKITEGGEEKYVLVFKENFEQYQITVGTTVAYSRNINPSWSTEAPGRADGKYIWQWTHTEIYSFDGNKWSEKDDDKIACITGADGKDGAHGKDGAPGKDGDSIYTISIDNDFDSVPADVNGNVSNSYQWESETKHNVRVYYGKDTQDFTVVGQSGTAPSTGLCLKYKLTNVDLGNTPSVSDKVATAWINSLSADADAGNILYTLYVDGVETGITGKFSVAKIKSPAPTYTISIDNDFATIPTSTVNAKIYRKTSQKFKPTDNGYSRETIHVAGGNKILPGMRLSVVNNTANLNTALLWKPDEVIKITSDITKSYVEDITKHNVTVYCNDAVETITADNFIVKLDSDGLNADMDETQNYLVCELGGFDSTGTRATDFPGMNPTISDNVVTNYITALSALGDSSESKNVYIQYTYYAKGKPVATAKFEVTRHTGPTTYYLSSNVSTIKINKNVNPATITPDKVICTAYSLDTSTNTNTRFTNGTWKYKWDNGAWSSDKSTASDLEISTAEIIKNSYKQLYIELYLGNQLWDRETIDVIADGENAVDYRIIASSGTIKVTKTGNKDPQFITVDFKQINGSATPAAFSGSYKVFINNETDPTSYGTADSIVLATGGATGQQIDVSGATSRVTVDLYTTDGSTKLESETIDVVADGADGQPGVYIKEVKQWYILKASSFPEPGSEQTPETIKPADNDEPTYDPAPTSTTVDEWMSTPPEAVNGYNIWTCYGSIFSNNTPEDRHIEYSVPVKDATYALAQGKTTNYYSPTEPIHNVKKGDCWFDTGYVKIATNPDKKTGYLGKFVLHSDQDQNIEVDDKDKIYVQGINPDTSGTFTRFIPSENTSSQLYMVKITPYNIDKKGLFTVKTEGTAGTDAYETGNLKQCSGFNGDGKAIWTDIAGELVTNKLTANYINAMDITAKKITVLQDNSKESNDSNPILFQADGTSNNSGVKIGGFTVDSNRLYAGTPGSGSGIELSSYLTGLIAYKSNNQGVKSSEAVSKITVNKATNLTVYIRSDAESSWDYTMISNPNVSSYPTSSSSSDVKAHTSSNQNSSSDLTGYTKVEYYGLKQNDYIYIVYRKDGSTNVGADTGYFLIPETADVSISNAGATYYFVRDSAFDIKGASIKVGKNFSVDKDGNVFASSLIAPNLQIKEVNCAPTLSASSKNNYTKLGNWYILPGSDETIINLTPRTTMSTTIGGDGRSKFAWLYNHADDYTNSDTVNLAYQNILNAVSNSGWGSGAPDSLQPNCLTLGAPWMSLSQDYSYYHNYAYTQVTGGELGGLHFGVGNTYSGTDAELTCPLLPIWDWGSQGVWIFRSHNNDQKAWGSGIALDRSGSYVSDKANANAGTGNTWTLVGTWATQSAITVSSDKNAKNTINELSDKYTNFFNNLKPVSFKYNDGTSNRLHIGFIAQDVEQALAEADIPTQEFAGLVIKRADDDSTSYGLRYSEFIALNTAQIQKLNAKVSSLEDTIAELRAEIAALKN